MTKKILVALSDSIVSQSVLDHLIEMGYCHQDYHITLLHVFRKATAEEQLMGKKFSSEQQPRMLAMLERAKENLVKAGFNESSIHINLATTVYPTIADGIIEEFRKDHYQMVIIGRKRKSKSEEFALGDISVKLVRTLENTAVVVVKQSLKRDKSG